jgi:hypothetical protein
MRPAWSRDSPRKHMHRCASVDPSHRRLRCYSKRSCFDAPNQVKAERRAAGDNASSRFPNFHQIRVGVGVTKECYLSSILHGYQSTTQAYGDLGLDRIIL